MGEQRGTDEQAQWLEASHVSRQGMLKLTPSAIRDYLVCPYRFAHSYLQLGSKTMHPPATPAMSFGHTIRGVLERLYKPEHKLGHRLEQAQIAHLLSQCWDGKGYANSREEDAAFTKATLVLKYALRSPLVEPQSNSEILGTEVYLSGFTMLANRRVALACRIDRLELHNDGALEVLDYKTSESKAGAVPTSEELAADLPSYLSWMLAWGEYKHDPRVDNICVSQLNLITLKKATAHYSQAQIVRNKAALKDLVRAIHVGPFEPAPNRGCAWCPLRKGCPAWATK